MESESRILSIAYDERGNCLVTFLFHHRFREELKSLMEHSVTVSVKKFRQKRSKNANAYMWELVKQISIATGIPRDDVYRDAIRNVGECEDMEMTREAFAGMTKMWNAIGIGWFTEQVDYAEDGEKLLVRRYYGSSIYDTQQMKRLLDFIVQEAKNLDIPTERPDEIDRMISLWKGQ